MHCKIFPSLGWPILNYHYSPWSLNIHPWHTNKSISNFPRVRTKTPSPEQPITFSFKRVHATWTDTHRRQPRRIYCWPNNRFTPTWPGLAIFSPVAWLWTSAQSLDCFVRIVRLWSSWLMVSEWWWWVGHEVAFPSQVFAIIFPLRFWCTPAMSMLLLNVYFYYSVFNLVLIFIFVSSNTTPSWFSCRRGVSLGLLLSHWLPY